MGIQREFVSHLHKATKRDYLKRMTNEKVEAMIVAKKYDQDYWDGIRKFGYGGYTYIKDRWRNVAKQIIEAYNLGPGSRVLDIGCGKGFLLYEIQLLEPEINLYGFDISSYATNETPSELNANIFVHRAQDPYPFVEKFFDLVISLGTLHNLKIFELEMAFSEIERVGKSGYVMIESYRNEQELFNLECWALTIQSILDVEEWKWIFHKFGYTGDYEFIFFE